MATSSTERYYDWNGDVNLRDVRNEEWEKTPYSTN